MPILAVASRQKAQVVATVIRNTNLTVLGPKALERGHMQSASRPSSASKLLQGAGFAAAALALGLAASPVMARSEGVNKLRSPLGSYIAGRIARSHNHTVEAVRFYRHALKRAPNQPEILERAFLAEATEGNASRAIALARKLVRFQPQHRLARAWLGLAAFKARNFKQADRHFRRSNAGPIGELTGALARAWVAYRRGKTKLALSHLKYSQRAEWAQYYLRYHRALIADLSRRRKIADQNYSRIFKSDARMPRITISYLHHAANTGNFNLANQIVRRNKEATTGQVHPSVADVAQKIAKSKRLPLLIRNGNDGLAEVFYGLGEALTTEGGMQLGAIYLEMALYLKPEFPFALAARANVYEATKQYTTANAMYDKVPASSPLQQLIAIRKANNLDALKRTDEAVKVLRQLSKAHPGDIRPIDALANILRGRERYAEAILEYDKIIPMLGKPQPSHWHYWYARGTSYERVKKWPKAESDLTRANELSPDQPLVLNYLGYSWVDRNIKLQKGLKYIEKAVQLKPEDGYIVDSLGWAHFRLGNYAKAAEHLERAVVLRPSDPILNDHLGDALWRVGRIREARYQWELSLTLKPIPENERKTREKLAKGLPKLGVIKSAVSSDKKELTKRVETRVDKTKR
jgi:tetratricopeptide (TPR) repeat protein